MIKYVITEAELQVLIEAHKKGWIKRADDRTTEYENGGNYIEGRDIWSEIKDVFLRIQFDKCAYCERKLGSKENRKEYDIDHYRPKKAIETWPTDKMKERRSYAYAFSLGGDTDKGYYLLAHNFRNYAASCTGCNSTRKASFFPVSGTRVLVSNDYSELAKESPYLLFPIGNIDSDDPEALISFKGHLPVPKISNKSALGHKRARVTIDFFDLDVSDTLIRERSDIIVNLWNNHKILKNPNSDDEQINDAEFMIELAISSSNAHSNCARAYLQVCNADLAMARIYKNAAKTELKRIATLLSNAP